MFLRIITLFFFLFTAISEAKLPNLTAKDARFKTEEILRAHVLYKKLSTEIIERTLKNFVEELDPSKTYFLEWDIEKWLYPTEKMTKEILEKFKDQDFTVFQNIQEAMIEAIHRRNEIEREVEVSELPQDVDPEEFNNIPWAASKQELITRLLRIKSVQLVAAEKFNEETKSQFLQRMKKRRLHREEEILNTKGDNNNLLMLSNLLKAISSALDSHTNYFTPTEADQFLIQVQQRLFGIGAQLKDNLNGFKVTRILEGSPASKENKLKLNDLIIAVNHEPIVGMDIIDAVEMIRGKKGSKVTLTIIREGKDTEQKMPQQKINIEIARGEIILEESRFESSFEPYGNGAIGYLRLFSFYQDPKYSSANDLRKALENLKKEHQLKGIVLDLRGNAGGLLPQSVAVTSLFIGKGIVVSIKDEAGRIQHLRNMENNTSWDGPLVVLIDRASASAAEIVAQTLQDYGRAIIVGDDHTFGKGTFQTFSLDSAKNEIKVNPQGEYKVTRGMYYTVSGKSPQLTGVKADLLVPGILSALEIGEEFAKYPLPNDQIKEHFDDDLSDIPPLHRKRFGLLYKHGLQKKITTFTQYTEALKNNSQKRMLSNKNYQNFLREIKNKKIEADPIEIFGQSDLQKVETFNIMKDLVFLMEIEEKTASSF